MYGLFEKQVVLAFYLFQFVHVKTTVYGMSVNGSNYNAHSLQFLKVLRNSGTRKGQKAGNVTGFYLALFGQQLQDGNPCRMRQDFAERSNFLLLTGKLI
jgi:hypothetical protein